MIKMKILFAHADYLKYEVKEETKFAEAVDESRRAANVTNPLIAFTCVEKSDEKINDIVEEASNEIKDVANKVKAKDIVIFPFAHLSPDLASPTFAVNLLTELEHRLGGDGHTVLRAPFGWYKVFEFRTKGHPLALLSRSIPNQQTKKSE
jgi:threonyl-tRNA synthetase